MPLCVFSTILQYDPSGRQIAFVNIDLLINSANAN